MERSVQGNSGAGSALAMALGVLALVHGSQGLAACIESAHSKAALRTPTRCDHPSCVLEAFPRSLRAAGKQAAN